MPSRFRSISLRLSEEKDADILNFIDSEVRNKRLSKADILRQALLAQMSDNNSSKTSQQHTKVRKSDLPKNDSMSVCSKNDQRKIEHAKELLLNGFTGV